MRDKNALESLSFTRWTRKTTTYRLKSPTKEKANGAWVSRSPSELLSQTWFLNKLWQWLPPWRAKMVMTKRRLKIKLEKPNKLRNSKRSLLSLLKLDLNSRLTSRRNRLRWKSWSPPSKSLSKYRPRKKENWQDREVSGTLATTTGSRRMSRHGLMSNLKKSSLLSLITRRTLSLVSTILRPVREMLASPLERERRSFPSITPSTSDGL